MRIAIINGPNLNLLGRREPHIYGSQSFEDYFVSLAAAFPAVELTYFQSNHEGVLIDHLHDCMTNADGVVMNPGGYAHTSVSLADAIAALGIPVIEVHISNVAAREHFRHHSYTAARCKGTISGLGLDGYALAVRHLLAHHEP
jgi:3-dehydroquinate dehydratase II